MVMGRKPNGYWTKERCKKEALKHQHRVDFQKKSPNAYDATLRKGWLGELCVHMTPLGHKMKRHIYRYTFEDGYAYVGITSNIKRRNNSHFNSNRSLVYRHMKETGLIPEIEVLEEFVDISVVGQKEDEYMKETSKLYKLLNKNKAGGLGCVERYWTKEKCYEEALKFNCRKDFYTNSKRCYDACCRNGWLEEMCKHMQSTKKPNGYWTKERCLEISCTCSSRSEFKEKNASAYRKSRQKGWLDEICSHMVK